MLKQALDHVSTVAIGGHVRPDGDCVGSCMGLYLYIRKCYPQITVDVYLEEIPASFHMFEVIKEIHHSIKEDKQYDLFIALDCADVSRLGFSEVLFHNAKNTLCIDHHISNPSYAKSNYIVPEASSTAELVYNVLDTDAITTEIAECLYLGIAHDTGIFQYSSTSPVTMEIAADLMRRNIRASEIIDKTYYEKTYVQNKILGKALKDSVLILGGKCIVSYITKEMMEQYGAIPSDLEGIVSQLRNTQGVEASIFLYEIGNKEYKVSLRASGIVNVSWVASQFGGGGHVKAAGVTMVGEIPDIIEKLSEEIGKQL